MHLPTLLVVIMSLFSCLAGFSGMVQATEAKDRLGGPDLTPLGAERRGNADGSIPAWEGGITEPPPAYLPGSQEIDPYPDEQALFSISAA